jgi:hypothetical protein
MSTRISGMTAGHILPMLVAATILAAGASAAGPNKSLGPSKPSDPKRVSDPNASVRKEKAPARTPTAPALRPVPPAPRRGSASFTPSMPFSEAIDILRNATTPPVNIVVLWRDLENAGVYRDTPIGIDGVPGLKVGQCLDLLTASLSAGASVKIGYVVRNGAVVVATVDGLPAPQKMARVYDISDLVAEPARYGFSPFGFGGMGGMGYGGNGGGMMGPMGGGYGGAYGGYGPGTSYMSGNSYGANSTRNLSGFVGSTSGGAPRPGR